MGCLESRPIVRSVSGDTDNITTFLEHLDQDSLILRRGSCKDLQSRGNNFHDVRRECAEAWPFPDNAISVDVALLRDQPGSEHVVSRTHRHTDAGLFTFGYGPEDTFSEGVLDAGNTNKREVSRQVIVLNLLKASQRLSFLARKESVTSPSCIAARH